MRAGLKPFGTMQKAIDYRTIFFNENKIKLKLKLKLKLALEFGGVLGCCQKAFNEFNLIDFISKIPT